MKNNVSIILRVKNEENHIGYCIQSILNTFEFPEIIVVNNNSEDESINIIKHFEKDTSLNSTDKRYTKMKITNISDYTPGKALNLGIKHASQKYCLIISAHCKIIKFNLEKNIEYLKKNIAIYGKQIPIWNGKQITKRYIWSNFGEKNKVNYFTKHENRYFFHNAFSFFTKQTLVDFPFNEKLTSKEDRYWAQNIIENQGKNILYNSDDIVEHYYTKNGATWKNI
jgi:rhamnosyltransferase